MPRQLSDQTIAVVKATVPALEARGLDITRRMYARMFQNEAIRDLFNQSHHGETGSQPKALAAAVLAYAQNIDNLGVLTAAVERIAQKHVGLNILPEHYPFVAEALLGAIQDVLGEAATPEILGAWGEAYWFLADVLIGREQQIYAEHASAPGGWNGWRDFTVRDKTRESDIVTSFTLAPADGGKVLRHQPGQYLTFWLEIPGHAPLKRNYSISCAPDDRQYRISVKREPRGVASNWLHDMVQPGARLKVAAPAGEFFLPGVPQRPVVLLSGGVGQTPLMSMLQTMAAMPGTAPVQFIHGTLSGATHALGAEARSLAAASGGRISTTTFYEHPRAEDRQGLDYNHAGRITAEWLQAHTPGAEADYYLCGPREFLRVFTHALVAQGVPAARIHYEFFGPADELLAA
ncbi:NO-inducible flavohemoprotein [Pseudoroseomonas wenyumeiae]|uniref:Flavohemoprotein n=1 Tax=Teichococcus wenyumeiae TaxID=2478470 RepID=A0A3A9JBE0_9PROT|nr:NO-inducible flavohemoprotein [Pseudoroseomonas wenyumeiae]RKK04617.1 NO-inducible flavohemoprotein [Pseudoroseomonas wenyumeiae]RMI17350.1 NO-inducible flavohemoprotein [Pseudoroseomonas wenyumeiae]